ncbi:MAG: hypothetical protein NZM44_00405 [Candidatus Calescibacterium sp.]|nr:hypothetical protein [Candidatus Calescibacterium sp.]
MPLVSVPANYYVVPCEATILGKVIQDANQFTIQNAFWTLNTFQVIKGITNINMSFSLENQMFRGIGDCMAIRKPTAWNASVEVTRFITGDSFYRLINQGNPQNGFVFGSSSQFGYNVVGGFILQIPNSAYNKKLSLGVAGIVSNASMSQTRDRVEETISIQAHSNNTTYANYS